MPHEARRIRRRLPPVVHRVARPPEEGGRAQAAPASVFDEEPLVAEVEPDEPGDPDEPDDSDDFAVEVEDDFASDRLSVR
jgi:hypothetical protein